MQLFSLPFFYSSLGASVCTGKLPWHMTEDLNPNMRLCCRPLPAMEKIRFEKIFVEQNSRHWRTANYNQQYLRQEFLLFLSALQSK
jgi:hypothetical protein